MTARLRVENLSKSFGPARVLDRVSFTVSPGRFLVLLGPSGSGKTTLLRCLAGIERADSGSVHLGELPLAHGRTHLAPDRRDLAMVFQDYALWPHMTATGNVGYALRRRRLDREQARRRVERALERVGLSGQAEQYPHQLSGGQQQRVALARALVAEPGLLLFDEPLSNLDADLRERLRVEIATLTRESGATVVYITHDQAEAFALADEIGVLEGGSLVQLGSPEDVYHRPASPFVARFTGLAGELPGELIAGGSAAGTVVDTAYRGRGYDHVVELPGGTRLTGIFDRNAHSRGTRVHLLLDPEGCFAFGDPRAGDLPASENTAAPAEADRASAAGAAETDPIRTTLEVR